MTRAASDGFLMKMLFEASPEKKEIILRAASETQKKAMTDVHFWIGFE
jgi:hypothetical protein